MKHSHAAFLNVIDLYRNKGVDISVVQPFHDVDSMTPLYPARSISYFLRP